MKTWLKTKLDNWWIVEEIVEEIPNTFRRVGFVDSDDDARLVVAAPDLLRACEAIDEHFKSRMGIDYSYESGEEHDLHIKAKYAIEKAKGGAA